MKPRRRARQPSEDDNEPKAELREFEPESKKEKPSKKKLKRSNSNPEFAEGVVVADSTAAGTNMRESVNKSARVQEGQRLSPRSQAWHEL